MLDKNFLRASKVVRVKILKSKENELEQIKDIDIYEEMLKCINLNECEEIINNIDLKKEEELLNKNLKKISLRSEIEYLKKYINLLN